MWSGGWGVWCEGRDCENLILVLDKALPRVGMHVFWSTILKLCSEFHANVCIFIILIVLKTPF